MGLTILVTVTTDDGRTMTASLYNLAWLFEKHELAGGEWMQEHIIGYINASSEAKLEEIVDRAWSMDLTLSFTVLK